MVPREADPQMAVSQNILNGSVGDKSVIPTTAMMKVGIEKRNARATRIPSCRASRRWAWRESWSSASLALIGWILKGPRAAIERCSVRRVNPWGGLGM